MKLILTFCFIFAFAPSDLSNVENNPDSIVGSFYSNIYSFDDVKTNLTFVAAIPNDFQQNGIYKPEYDVGWQFDFLENGAIKITGLFLYYCGFDAVILEKGSWKNLGNGQYKITLNGISYDKPFSFVQKYRLVDGKDDVRRFVEF